MFSLESNTTTVILRLKECALDGMKNLTSTERNVAVPIRNVGLWKGQESY